MATVLHSLARQWLFGTFIVLSILVGYANSPLYGAEPTPTPNVSTVPKPGLFLTPTPTITPVIVILTRPANITATAPAQASTPNAAGTPPAPAATLPAAASQPATAPQVTGNSGSSSAAPATTSGLTAISTAPLALYQLPSLTAPVLATLPAGVTVTILGRNPAVDWLVVCCSNQQQSGWTPAMALQIAATGTLTLADLPVLAPPGVDSRAVSTATTTAALTLQVQEKTVLIWPGVNRQVHLAITNRSSSDLTQLQLRYHLPATLTLVNATLDQSGATVINSPSAQGILLLLRWSQLPAASQVIATLTISVNSSVPNGTFLDNPIVIESSNGATASATFTLVLPPADLPRFPTP